MRTLHLRSSINGPLRSPFTCPSLQAELLLDPDSAACRAYQHLVELFIQYFRTRFYNQYIQPQEQQRLPLQVFLELSLELDQQSVLEAEGHLREKVDPELHAKYGMGCVDAYRNYPIMYLQGIGAPSEASWCWNHLLSGSSGTATYSSISDRTSQPVLGPQGASSATTPGASDHPPGTSTGEPEPWKYDHSTYARFDSSDQAHDLQCMSGQFDGVSTSPPSLHLEVDDDESGTNQPRLPPSQMVTQVGPPLIFTDQLLDEGDKEARQGRSTTGRYSCLMCRQKFSGCAESLRHLGHAHLLLEVWPCDVGECADHWTDTPEHRLLLPGKRGRVFLRQDYYIKHLRNKHGIVDAAERAEHAQQAKEVLCPLPMRLRCTVPGCKVEYTGDKALSNYLEHAHEDHPEELEGIGWRNALMPHLLYVGRVIIEPEGLRLATYRDANPFSSSALPFAWPPLPRDTLPAEPDAS